MLGRGLFMVVALVALLEAAPPKYTHPILSLSDAILMAPLEDAASFLAFGKCLENWEACNPVDKQIKDAVARLSRERVCTECTAAENESITKKFNQFNAAVKQRYPDSLANYGRLLREVLGSREILSVSNTLMATPLATEESFNQFLNCIENISACPNPKFSSLINVVGRLDANQKCVQCSDAENELIKTRLGEFAGGIKAKFGEEMLQRYQQLFGSVLGSL